MPEIRYSRVLSLSHPIAPTIPLWPGDPPVTVAAVADLDRDGYFLRRVGFGEHSATHANAPRSFFADGWAIDAYPPDAWVVPAVRMDGRAAAARDPDWRLGLAEVAAWEREWGPVPPGGVVLLDTGWQARWGNSRSEPLRDRVASPEENRVASPEENRVASPEENRAAFFNADEDGTMHFPGFHPAAIAWLLAERQIAGVGIDTHGVDGGQSEEFAVNRQVLGREPWGDPPRTGLVLECLARLDALPPRGTVLAIGALPLAGGSGSPVSVLAFVP